MADTVGIKILIKIRLFSVKRFQDFLHIICSSNVNIKLIIPPQRHHINKKYRQNITKNRKKNSTQAIA